MISIKRTVLRTTWLVMIWVIIASANVNAARGMAIDSVTVSRSGEVTSIEILFSCPNRYMDHNPSTDTDFLQINLLRLHQCTALNLFADKQQVDTPVDSALAALATIEYEPRQQEDAVLRIRFDQDVHAEITQSADYRLLSISVETVQSGNVLSSDVQESAGSASATTGAGVGLGEKQLSEPQLISLMGEGEAAILREDYGRAIQIYTRVLRAEETEYTPQALELLGLSRERNGQIAHAVGEYRRFLEHYPQHEGAQRVNQRLTGLVTAHKDPKPGRTRSPVAAKQSPWDVYGGISQYYRRDTFTLEGQESINIQSSILTDADLVIRRKGERIDFAGRATLGNLWDLLSEDKGPGNQTRLYQGYVEVADKITGLSGKVGRQTLRTSGVLGRFDGLHLGWEFRPGMRLNLMGGFPVDTTADGIETDRNFYGAAMDFEQVADLVDVSVFYNTQRIDGLENREAIGAEVRYFDDSKSLIALIDYDIGFSKLNNLVLLGNWRVKDNFTLSGSIDHRTSPFLTTRNALIGQPVSTIEELLLIYSSDEIRQLAEDRTGKVTSYRLGASHSLSERFQLNADVTMTDFKASPASFAVSQTPEQDASFYYSINIVGSRLFMDNDSSIFGLRHIDGGATTTSTLSIDSRFPVSREFRINPRLRVSYREVKRFGATSWIMLPSLRLLYRLGRRVRLDFEAGGEWTNQKSSDNAGDRSSWFLYFGYRADF